MAQRSQSVRTQERRAFRQKAAAAAPQSGYGRKLLNQLIISLMLLCGVYLCQTSGSSAAATLNKYVKTAITYRVNTAKIKELLSGISQISPVEKTIKKEETANEETKAANAESTAQSSGENAASQDI